MPRMHGDAGFAAKSLQLLVCPCLRLLFIFFSDFCDKGFHLLALLPTKSQVMICTKDMFGHCWCHLSLMYSFMASSHCAWVICNSGEGVGDGVTASRQFYKCGSAPPSSRFVAGWWLSLVLVAFSFQYPACAPIPLAGVFELGSYALLLHGGKMWLAMLRHPSRQLDNISLNAWQPPSDEKTPQY